jgi:hypothetical protein
MTAAPRRASALALGLALAGCAGALEPQGENHPIRDDEAADSPDYVFGRNIEVHTRRYAYLGELLACDGSNVYLRIHTRAPNAYRRIAWGSVESLHVFVGAWGPGALAWSILGTVATAGTGIMAIGFAPAWALAGTIVTALEWSRGENARDCGSIARYARFPQGLPPAWRAESSAAPTEATMPSAPEALPAIEIGATVTPQPSSSSPPTTETSGSP